MSYVFRVAKFSAVNWLAVISLIAVIVILILPRQALMVNICGALSIPALRGSIGVMLVLISPWSLALSWLLMVIIMMPPLTAQSLFHVWHSSFPKRRSLTIAAFSFSYMGIWMMTVIIYIPLTIVLNIVAQKFLVQCGTVLFALIWSASPIAQLARNQCHKLFRIHPFGYRSFLDSSRYGFKTGIWCVISCWPWMLVPLIVQDFHVIMMIIVAFILYWERISPPQTPRWREPPIFSVSKIYFRYYNLLGRR